MNFQQLEYVMAVHKHKHFGIAADSCHITQATLSAMIKKLEEELKILLFDRSRKPIQTTDMGLQFIETARTILQQKELLFSLNKQTEKLEGKLSIGIIPTVANSLLPIILPSILKENQKLQLTISEITTEEIKTQLIMDKIDIGILATPINDKQFDEHILYYEPMMIYGILDKKKEYINSKDIKNGNIWLLEEGHCFRNQALTICEIKEKELSPSNLNFMGSSFETLLNLTDKFGGYTLIPELYYKNMSKQKQNRTKHFQKPIPVREISIVTYRHFAKNQSIKYLSALIQKLTNTHLSTKSYKNKDLDIIGI
jgi:LysR family hydrogen peroxide-inducible transcriptional activator